MPPDPHHFGLAENTFVLDTAGVPQRITCPSRQTGRIRWGREGRAWVADFEPAICQTCVFHQTGRCRAKPGRRDGRFHHDFYLAEVRTARRHELARSD